MSPFAIDIKLIENTVRVDNPEVAEELQTVVIDRLKYRKAIRESLALADSGRIYNALEVLRQAYPQAAARVEEAGVGETATNHERTTS